MEENWMTPFRDAQCKPPTPDPDGQKRTEQLEFLDYLERALLKKIKKENQTSDVKRRFTKSRLLTYRNMKFMEEETTVANLVKYHKQLRKRAAYYKKEFKELSNELNQVNRVFKKKLGIEEYASKPVKELLTWKRAQHQRRISVGPSPDQPRMQCGRYSTQVTDSIVGPDSLESLIRSRNASFSNIGMRCPVTEALCWFNRNKHMGEKTYNVCINKQIYFLRRPEYVEEFVKDAQYNVTTSISNGYTALYSCEKVFTGMIIGIFGANENFVKDLSKDLDIPAYSLTDIFIKPIVYEHLQTSPRYLFSFFRSGIGMNAPIFIDQLRLFLQLVVLPYENHVIFHGMRMTHELQQSMKMFGLKFHVLVNVEPQQPPNRTISHKYSIEISFTHVNASPRGLNEDIFFFQLNRFVQLLVFTTYRLLTKTQFVVPPKRPAA